MSNIVALLLTVAAFAAWYLGRRRLEGTTLTSVWWWRIATVCALGLFEAGVGFVWGDNAASTSTIRFALAVGLFCPTMALLGARRPQNLGWWFVVITLWVVLVLPALQFVALGRADHMQLDAVRAWFLWGLIAFEAVHRFGTIYWIVGMLQAAAQVLLLGRYLPFLGLTSNSTIQITALGLITLAMWCNLLSVRRRFRSLDRLWLDFRDLFGLLWGLRVMERVNKAIYIYDWQVRLTWHGFTAIDSDPPAELEDVMRNMLRRFVSEEWMERRTGKMRESEIPAPKQRSASSTVKVM